MELTGAEIKAEQMDISITDRDFFYDLDGNYGEVLEVNGNNVIVTMRKLNKTYDIELFKKDDITKKWELKESIKQDETIIELNCFSCRRAKIETDSVFCRKSKMTFTIAEAKIECAARTSKTKSNVKELKQVWNVDEDIKELIRLNKLYDTMDNVSDDIEDVRNNVMDKILFNHSFIGKINKLAKKYYEILNKKFGDSDFRHIIRRGVYTQMRTYGLIDMMEIDKPVAHLYHYLFKPFKSGRTRVDSYLVNMINRPNTNESSIYHPEKKELKALVAEELTFNQNNKFENMTKKQSQGARSILKFSVYWNDYRFKSYKENQINDTDKYSIQYGFEVKNVVERLYDLNLDLKKYKEVCKDKFRKWENWKEACKKKETIVYTGRVENEITKYMDDKILLLEPKQQEVIKLYYFENMTLKEIESKISIPKSTVDRWKGKGLKKLKEIIVNDKTNIREVFSGSVLTQYV